MDNFFTAADVNHYIDWLGRISYRNYNDDTTYTEKSYKLINELFELVKGKIKPVNAGRYVYWIPASKGNVESFAKYHIEEDEPINNEIIDWWNDEIPNDPMLYEVLIVTDDNDASYYHGIFLNNRFVIEDDCEKPHSSYPYNIESLLEWIICETKNMIGELEKGIYNDKVKLLIPHSLLTGTILRKDLWDIFTEEREELHNRLSNEEIAEFCSLAANIPRDFREF